MKFIIWSEKSGLLVFRTRTLMKDGHKDRQTDGQTMDQWQSYFFWRKKKSFTRTTARNWSIDQQTDRHRRWLKTDLLECAGQDLKSGQWWEMDWGSDRVTDRQTDTWTDGDWYPTYLYASNQIQNKDGDNGSQDEKYSKNDTDDHQFCKILQEHINKSWYIKHVLLVWSCRMN